MQPTFVFRNIEATDGLRNHATEKLHKLSKYFHRPESIHIILTVERNDHHAEITLTDHGHRYVGHGTTQDMYSSIDQSIKRVEEQLRKHKERATHHKGQPSVPELSTDVE